MINLIEHLFNTEDKDPLNAIANKPVNKNTKKNFEQIYRTLRTSKEKREDNGLNNPIEEDRESLIDETDDDEKTKDSCAAASLLNYLHIQSSVKSGEDQEILGTDLGNDVDSTIDEGYSYISMEDMREDEVSDIEISDSKFSITEGHTPKEDPMSIGEEQSMQFNQIWHKVDESATIGGSPDSLENLNAENGYIAKKISVQGLNDYEEKLDKLKNSTPAQIQDLEGHRENKNPYLNRNITDVDDYSQSNDINMGIIDEIEIQDTKSYELAIERDKPKIKIYDHRVEGSLFHETLDGVSSDGMFTHSPSSSEENNFFIDSHESMDIVHRLSEEIYANLQEDRSEVVVHLKPEFLGKVTLEISLDRDVLSARIVTESYATRDIISTQLDDLKHTLDDKGYTIGNLDVDISQSDSQPHRFYSQPQNYLQSRTNNQSVDIGALDTDVDYQMNGYVLSSSNAGNIDYFA